MTGILDKMNDISSFFDQRVKQYGYTPHGCDYYSWETQQLRFGVMAGVADLNGRSILDVGCGFADFHAYLKAQDVRDFSYRGVDISAQMIEGGKARNPEADIAVSNILTSEQAAADVVVANGIFYLLGDDGWQHMRQIVTRLYELSQLAVAFSSLSSYATRKSAEEFYCDPLKAFEFCRSLTTRLTLRHDYHPGDFTIYMYRDGKA